MNVLVIIGNYRSAGLVADCLASLAPEVRGVASDGEDVRVVVVENASGEAEVLGSMIAERGWGGSGGWCELMELEENRGFAAGNNAAIRPALASDRPPDYVLPLNPDTVVRPGGMRELMAFMESYPTVGVCGSRLEYPDGSTQFGARRFPGVLSEFESMLRLGPVSRVLRQWQITEPESDQPHPTDWLPGAAMMIRRELFEQIGLLDDGYFMYYEEVDFCLRAKRAGWEVWYVPQSRVIHLVGQSSGVTSGRPRRRPPYWYDSRRRYFEKNYGTGRRMAADIAFATGLAGHKVRSVLSRRPDPDPPHLLGDFLRHSLTGSLRP